MIRSFLKPLFFCSLVSWQCNNGDEDLRVPDVVDFNYHIRPILSDRCFACHGPDEKTREAELSLHLEEGIYAAMDDGSGHAVVLPGNPEKSELYLRISSEDPEFQMPPPSSNLSLSEYEIKVIRKWIKQGANWKKHWAFLPPEKPDIPRIRDDLWQKNPIDAFVYQTLNAQGLKSSPPDLPEKWLRRVCFDLTGLPPSIDMIESFRQSHAETDYEEIVDQLLASPAYGEHMATGWLDLARYADSHGYQDDRPRTIWPWRDWVIRAFNKNMPYDQFVTWQLAGDLLPDAGYEQKLATAFNRNHAITQEGGVINEEYLSEYAADRVQTFSTAFLGLTMQCARCHDHKYDPISQKEFYELFAFFNNVEGERGQISYFDLAPSPAIPMQDSSYIHYIESVKTRIRELEESLEVIVLNEKTEFEKTSSSTIPTEAEMEQKRMIHYSLDDEGFPCLESVSQSLVGNPNLKLPPHHLYPAKVDGVEGSALEFNGHNLLNLDEVADFDHWNSFSFSLWVRHSGYPENDAAIFSRRNEELNQEGYDLTLLKNRLLSFRLIHKTNGEKIEVHSEKPMIAGQWTHIGVTYDGSGRGKGIHLYINGQPSGTKIVRDDLGHRSIANGNDLILGHWNHRARLAHNQFGFKNGRIDLFSAFSSELSPIEMLVLAGRNIHSVPADDRFRDHLLRHSFIYQKTKATLDSLRSIDLSIPMVMVMDERDTLLPAYILERGVYDAKKEVVSRATPLEILPFESFEKNRLGLSNWLTDPQNPLFSRVTVNRLWQQCFGQGLVKTTEDFGNQGSLPTHPALLDWLAVELRDQEWDLQKLLKLIVLSQTYRQSQFFEEKKIRKDPENKYLSRAPYRPLTAEMVRDHALYSSGLLYEKVGGKWVKPPQPGQIWKELANQIGENKYRASIGRDKYRRSLYTYWKRTIPPPVLTTLDAPERSVCTVKRQPTSTPLQSLILLNDPLFLEASAQIVKHFTEKWSDPHPVLKYAFLAIVSREIEETELDKLLSFWKSNMEHFRDLPSEALRLLETAGLSSAEEERAGLAATIVTISFLYNLDEARYY